MSELSFNAYEEDGTPRVFIGMHRPPRIKPNGYIACSCGTILQTMQQTEDHYQMGHFDFPLYRSEDTEETP